MHSGSISASLGATFETLDKLAARHREAEAYEAATERLTYLHGRMCHLQRTLAELHAAAEVLGDVFADGEDQRTGDVRAASYAHARRTRYVPQGAPLINGDLDLLYLVEYTGAAIALAQERYSQLLDRIVMHMSCTSQQYASISAAGRQRIEVVIAHVATGKGAVPRTLTDLVAEIEHMDAHGQER